MFIHYLFDGTVDDLFTIQAVFRDSIYGSDASITSRYSVIWLELKTQAYIRQKESDPRASVEQIFPNNERDVTHLFMGSKGGRVSSALIESRRDYMARADYLKITDIDTMLDEFPWPDFLRKMVDFTAEERKIVDQPISNQALDASLEFAAP